MSITLDLPKKLEATLSAQASRAGMSLSDYALRMLARDNDPLVKIRNGAELVAYWKAEGVVGSRKDIPNGARHARAVRRKAETRTRRTRGE
jgi:hypothetical protein